MIASPATFHAKDSRGKDAEWLSGPPGYPAGTPVRFVGSEGRGESGVLLVGEAAGEREEADGMPFRPYAEAGSVLERALYRAGVPRQSLTITNLIPYRPPRNWLEGAPWEVEAIEYGRGWLDRIVRAVKPRCILALGGLAMRELTGLAGAKAGITLTRGFQCCSVNYRLEDGGCVPAVGTYHPSFLRRGSKERQATGPKGKVEAAGGGTQGMSLLGVLIRDILLAKEIARDGPKGFNPAGHILGARLDDWKEALQSLRAAGASASPVFYDFETLDSIEADDESKMEVVHRNVTQVQISFGERILVSEWFPELLETFRAIMEGPWTKVDWNGRKFDRPVARDMQIRTDLGEWHDEMDFWHSAQPDLPRGLQYAASFAAPEIGPWKHLSASDPLWYGMMDVLAPRRIWEWLHRSMGSVRHPVSGVSLLEGYRDQVVRLSPVLDRMSARGIPVDEAKRQELDREFTATIERIEGECQSLHPDELKNVSPKNGYCRPPEEAVEICAACAGKGKVKPEGAKARVTCGVCGGSKKILREKMPEGLIERSFTAEVKCVCGWAKKGAAAEALEPCEACSNTGRITTTVTRFCRLERFLPGSWQQVLSYIEFRREEDLAAIGAKHFAKYKGSGGDSRAYAAQRTEWKIPVDHKTGKPTTAEAELRRLATRTKDALLPKVLECKELSTARGTFVRGWEPKGDGRVHPNFGYRPATPQLSSDNPNAQNWPAHGDLAQKMSVMIAAVRGKVMVKFDWKSFFIITGGFEARDANFIRIGRIDMHSFVTLVGLLRLERPEVAFAWDDEEMKSRLKWWKKQDKRYSEYARKAHPGGMTFGEIRDEISKRVDFGWLNGQSAFGLARLWPETFPSASDAEVCQAALRRLFPRVDAWQDEVRLRADQAKPCPHLITRFGHIRYFWDVFQRRPVEDNYAPRGDEKVYVNSSGQRWSLKRGDDSEAVVAYMPNADAYGIKRRALVEIGEREWDEKYGLIADVHDAIFFECEVELVESLRADIQPLMEAPCPLLVDAEAAPEGLWCGVEGKIGKDWAGWEDLR